MSKKNTIKKQVKKPFKSGKSVKWSDGFKEGSKKCGKPCKDDDVVFEDGAFLLLNESAEVLSINGDVSIFAVNNCELKVNGKKIV